MKLTVEQTALLMKTRRALEEHGNDKLAEALEQMLLDAGDLEECGCCGSHHPMGYTGDCRNDEMRLI